MVKELILAIILGAVLGFGITGGLVTLNKKTPPKPSSPIVSQTVNPTDSPSNQPTETLLPTPTQEDSLLTIDSPENETIVQSSRLTIKGQTMPQSTLIIITPVKMYTLTASDTGKFSQEVDLETGVNLVQINTTTQENLQSEKELVITYSTAQI
jgi:hypothetical protein